MSRLIDKEMALVHLQKRLYETALNNVGIQEAVDKVLADIASSRLKIWFSDMPTVDAIEVVRCKECKYRQDDGYCEAWADMFHHWEGYYPTDPEGYCDKGERKDGR